MLADARRYPEKWGWKKEKPDFVAHQISPEVDRECINNIDFIKLKSSW